MIPHDLLPRTRQILLPLVETEDEREALLTDAFYTVSDSRIYHQIKRDGTPISFTTVCIKKLLDYGCLTEGTHALGQLLNTVKYYCGVDKHANIDQLIAVTKQLCADISVTPTEPVPPVQVDAVTSAPQSINTPADERTPTIFISYSHQDTEIAQRVIADLNKAGHACWIDSTKIKSGDEWIMTIAEGIINSYAVVPLVTLKALQSKWVQDEILWARQKNKLIIPLILENVLAEKRFFPLVSYQGVTVFDSDYETSLAKLLSYLPNPMLADVHVSEAELKGDKFAETVINREPHVILRKLELAYMQRLQFEELLNTEKYTAMGGHSQKMHQRAEIRAVFELLPMGESDEIETKPEPFEDAVAEIQRIQRAVLLGEPGGGKTTTLWKLAADLVDKALTDHNAAIPLLIRLGKWTEATQPLHAFIASQIGDLGAYLDDLLREKRVALLLDGLNEIPASQRKSKYSQVQTFIEAYPDLLAVVSCRELDYTIDLGFDRINIRPLDPIRIREFVIKYLGEQRGRDLFFILKGTSKNIEETFYDSWDWLTDDEYDSLDWMNDDGNVLVDYSELMDMARNPYMLLMLTSVFDKLGTVPHRADIFIQFVDTLFERENISSADRDALLDGIAKVAFEMQIIRNDNNKFSASTVLPANEVKEILGDRNYYLAVSASILTLGDQTRFTHQLLQEYFAVTYMDNEIKAGRLKATDIWHPDNWWERTNWEETTYLLYDFYREDPTFLVEWMMEAQPELTVQCLNRSGISNPDDNLLIMFREKLLPHLTDIQIQPNPLARLKIGQGLGQLRLSTGELLDNRKGVGLSKLGNRPVPDIYWIDISEKEIDFHNSRGEDENFSSGNNQVIVPSVLRMLFERGFAARLANKSLRTLGIWGSNSENRLARGRRRRI